MPDELSVQVGREELHGLEVPPSFSTDGSFDVVFENYGQSVHVHLHLDDGLSEVAALDANNHYVEGETTRAVRVNVATDRLPDDPITGTLKVATGYGAKTHWINVRIHPPTSTDGSVEIDESLGQPQPKERTESSPISSGTPELLILGLAAVTLVGAVTVGLLLDDLIVRLGAVAVVIGVVGAVYILLR